MSNTGNLSVIWRKSSFSVNGDCVEIAIQNESVLIRDTKDRNGGIISVSCSAWRELIQAIQRENNI
jgi:hypothetical protein